MAGSVRNNEPPERIGLVPDNRLLLAFDGFQLTGSLKSWSSALAQSVLFDCAERSQSGCLRIVTA